MCDTEAALTGHERVQKELRCAAAGVLLPWWGLNIGRRPGQPAATAPRLARLGGSSQTSARRFPRFEHFPTAHELRTLPNHAPPSAKPNEHVAAARFRPGW